MNRVASVIGHLCSASSSSSTSVAPSSLAPMIDHTLLRADATQLQIEQLCDEAAKYSFASVCVNPNWVHVCASRLKNTSVKVCTVIGFPLGANDSLIKASEAEHAIRQGAREVDMVINVGRLKSGHYDYIKDDIAGVVRASRAAGRARGVSAVVKVIIETALLTDDEKVKVCQIATAAGADFVKTSTGFSTGGATVSDVKLMRQTVTPNIGVKASGSIRDYQTAVAMVNNGANRLGTSSGVVIVTHNPNATAPTSAKASTSAY